MRVLQLIDSLRPGGAEQMAVSYANALAKKGEGSYLCCTRIEGTLKKKLSSEVGYLFLKKKSTYDFMAAFELGKFIQKQKINLIHAHGSSWFFAVVMKMKGLNVRIVWHDHWGQRAFEKEAPSILKFFSRYFDGIISANEPLKLWAKENLLCKKVQYLQNFIPSVKSPGSKQQLKRENDFKIICVANLKPPKDHLNLLFAFKLLVEKQENLSLHLIGKDERNAYSKKVHNFIALNALEERIFIYGEQENIDSYLLEADLGVLSSSSEGLPVALLEYGRAGLPVVCTNVGECAEVVGRWGRIVPKNDPYALAEELLFYLENKERRESDGRNFQKKVQNEFSEEVVIEQTINYFEEIISKAKI